MDAFLHRHEHKALRRRLKKEALLAVVPAYRDERLGLLGITSSRVLFASRRTLRTRVDAWDRKQIKGARLEARRYGVLAIAAPGKIERFDLTRSEDKQLLRGTILPRERKVDPVKALTRTARRAPLKSQPAPDPLAHLGTPEHEAKLRDMFARGVITKQELEWQLGK